MKKYFFIAIAVAIAFSFLGGQFILPNFQIVPVTEAQSMPAQATASVKSFGNTTAAAPTAFPTIAPFVTQQAVREEPAKTIAQAPTAIPTIAPFVTKQPVQAEPVSEVVTAEQAQLESFLQSVSGKDANLVTGVYVPGRFTLPVLQQPAGEASFVSTEDDTVTQFGSANPYGTIGLLAHNYLSGKKYFDLLEGDDVVIVYGDGSQTLYRVAEIQRYQALSPTSVYSDFIDLSDPSQTKLSAGQLFQRVYTKQNQVVFQTCIEASGDAPWGRIFIIAEKVSP